ncbi:glutamate racemase [Alsobacter metallidurans]|uniref:Glutamate racemase n=1 Tax=Alsobacter metallidurans TaxID=340221 RepID=A0A917IAG9_9HYPH|nr:glutamate racemase [Alsobacter metallidurans]GGH26314.1 glutamate racemase [Alsobacter metallidurans]
MRVDLWAGIQYDGAAMSPPRAPVILVFDSGLGGLTVYREILKARPDARFVYAADDAAFPYGRLDERALVSRVVAVMERLVALHAPDIVVIACNTASTLVLPALRARFPIPFVGTVPAIKPAAERSRTRHVAVLATPGTVKRDYTQALIAEFAGDCRVTLVGSTRLAGMAEAFLRGEAVDDAALAAEIAPCFPAGEPRTDVVVLGCTHYPLLLPHFEALAPWPVAWIDPAPAIARRVVQLIGAPLLAHEGDEDATMLFTGGAGLTPALGRALEAFGLGRVDVEAMPLAVSA